MPCLTLSRVKSNLLWYVVEENLPAEKKNTSYGERFFILKNKKKKKKEVLIKKENKGKRNQHNHISTMRMGEIVEISQGEVGRNPVKNTWGDIMDKIQYWCPEGSWHKRRHVIYRNQERITMAIRSTYRFELIYFYRSFRSFYRINFFFFAF